MVTHHPTSSSDVPVGRSVTLTCGASGLGYSRSIPGRGVLVINGLLLVMIMAQHHTLLKQNWLLDSTCTGVE